MDDFFDVSDISRLVHMAVAPVFLLTGIAGFLNVISGRIGRIVDRARSLEDAFSEGVTTPLAREEFRALLVRLQFAVRAIALCVSSAILIAALVAIIFLGGLFHFDPYEAIGVVFVLAMVLLIAGLLLFLLEIRMAVRHTWVGQSFTRDSPTSSGT